MGTALLQALQRRMKRLTLKREPVHPTLDEHLWALVLQHLDTLQDRVKASTSCRAAWKAGLLKVEIPVHLPIGGMSQITCIWIAPCVLHTNMTDRVHTCQLVT